MNFCKLFHNVRRGPALMLPVQGLLLLMLLFIGGCDNSFAPFDEQEGFYSIYGYLDLNENSNYLRIKDLNEVIQSGATGEAPFSVTMYDMDNGRREELEDTVVQFEGVYTHNYRTRMEIIPGNRYRVSAVGPEGDSTYATARAPLLVTPNVVGENRTCLDPVVVLLGPVVSPNDITAEVGVEYEGDLYFTNIYTLSGAADSTAYLSFNFTGNSFYPQEVIGEAVDVSGVECHNLSSDRIYIRYRVFSPDFFKQIESDSTVIPGGTGRFGALYDDSFSFPIDTTDVTPDLEASARGERKNGDGIRRTGGSLRVNGMDNQKRKR